MLNKYERFKVLKSLRFCCNVGLLPTQVNLATCQLSAPKFRKQCVCVVSYGCFVLHVLYKIVSLMYAYFCLPDVRLHQLIIHAAVSLGAAMCGFWYYVAYIKDPALFAAYVKATLAGNIGGPTHSKDQPQNKLTNRLSEKSLQDLLAASLPYLVWPAILVISSSYLYDPSMSLLLYAALPATLQNWATFGLLLLEEIRLLMILVTISIPIWQLQVISFELVSNQLQLLIQRAQKGMQSPRNTYRTLRRVQLYISMVNSLNSYIIYTWKVVSITECIVCGYAAIAHFREHPVFGIMYYFLLVDCAFIYTVIYEKAFKIPELLDQASSCAILAIPRGQLGVHRRQILSIPRTGVRVGCFHQLERASTLIFVDYVVSNIVSMLVAYQ